MTTTKCMKNKNEIRQQNKEARKQQHGLKEQTS